MAVIFQKKERDTDYRVTQAGRSVRLYKNRIFHSQWNPARPLSHHLWDLLFLPVIHHARPLDIKQTLVLGVGGGSVLNLFNRFLPNVVCDGVDLDDQHLKLARRFFLECKNKNQFFHADAVDYMHQNRKKYDVIVEDLFTENAEQAGDAIRAINADQAWLNSLSQSLTRDGLLIMNFEDLKRFNQVKRKLDFKKMDFREGFVLQMPNYENAIVILCKQYSLNRTLPKFKKAFFHNFNYNIAKHEFTQKSISF